MFIYEERIAELQEQLGPLLAEMGLELSVVEQFGDFVREVDVRFLPRPGATHFSPVTICFEARGDFRPDPWGEEKPVREASWDDAHFYVASYFCRPLGDSGFEHWMEEQGRGYKIRRPGKKLFEGIADFITAHDLMPTNGRTPGCVSSHAFANAYVIVARGFPDAEILQDIPEDGETLESIAFVDPSGRNVLICMPGGGGLATAYVDDEEEMSFEQTDIRTLRLFVRDLSRIEPSSGPSL